MIKTEELQAFPQGEDSGLGLTRKEYFAGLALQGLLANPEIGKTLYEYWDKFHLDEGRNYREYQSQLSIMALHQASTLCESIDKGY